jgi:hypothetical protein
MGLRYRLLAIPLRGDAAHGIAGCLAELDFSSALLS